ncbi:hypothetical protein Tco_0370927 [Tanacetum coccineum]
MLDQTFDCLQKLVSQLELLDEKLSQEDVNQKLLRSLSPEWNTHAIVWRNKADLDTMSMVDLYNNLVVYELEVKGMSSSSSSTQNMAFVSSSNNSTSSTNGAVNTAQAVNTAHGVSTASTQVNDAYITNIDNLSDAVICAFFASQPNRRKLTVNGNETIGFDKSVGYDWSDQAEEGPNYALMAFSSSSPNSEVSNDSICSKSCLETVELLKSQNDQLLKDLKKFELMVLCYKTREITIRELKKKLEIVQKEKDGIQLNVDKFEHASKSLNKLIECQIVDNCKKGLGYENYNAVPPPYNGNFMPPTPDLSFTGLDEFVNKPVVKNCKVMFSEEEPKVVRKNDDAPCIEEWASDDKEEDADITQLVYVVIVPWGFLFMSKSCALVAPVQAKDYKIKFPFAHNLKRDYGIRAADASSSKQSCDNEADPAFNAAVAQAVADLLPTLTARITDEIRPNKNNENNGNRRNSRRGNPGGSGNDGDAQPTDIHVWLKRILNTEFTDVAQVANAARNIEISYDRADDRRDSDRYGNHGRHGNRDRYGTDRWRGDRQGTVRHGNGSDRQGNDSQKAWHDQDQQEKAYHRATGCLPLNVENVGPIAKDCKKGSTSSEEKRFEEFTSKPIVIKLIVEKSKAKASKAKPKTVRKNNGAPIIED